MFAKKETEDAVVYTALPPFIDLEKHSGNHIKQICACNSSTKQPQDGGCICGNCKCVPRIRLENENQNPLPIHLSKIPVSLSHPIKKIVCMTTISFLVIGSVIIFLSTSSSIQHSHIHS